MAKMKMDPARSRLIGGFIDSYLRLTAQEMAQYAQALDELAPAEKETTMTLVSSWELEGIEKGLQQGRELLVLRQLRRRFGTISPESEARLARLSTDQLDDLGEALLDFTERADLEQWLAAHDVGEMKRTEM